MARLHSFVLETDDRDRAIHELEFVQAFIAHCEIKEAEVSIFRRYEVPMDKPRWFVICKRPLLPLEQAAHTEEENED